MKIQSKQVQNKVELVQPNSTPVNVSTGWLDKLKNKVVNISTKLTIDTDVYITPNFTWREFGCVEDNNGKKVFLKVPDEYRQNVIELCQSLEVLRKELGNKPIIVNSGWRSIKKNKAVGGVVNSQHLEGKASDIMVKGVKPQQLYNKIKELMQQGQMKIGGIGLYRGFVHYDIRGEYAYWTMLKKDM